MAGFRLTLKKLAKKYGVDIKGATYAQVVQEIVQDNVARASKKMGDLSNRRMKKAFADSIKNGIVDLPEYAIPNVTVRKGADDGKMITDTLRDTLTRGLRQAILENPNDTEKAIAQMQQSVKDTFNTYTTSHAKMIAVTEVRSSVDLSKAEYVKELIARNPNRLRVTKKWIHHDHLVKIPRPTHKAIDGEKVLFNQPFSIGLMYPHDPSAPASEVIGCQCGYQVEVEEMAINEAWKSLYQKLRIYKAYKVGTRRQRADGYTYEKQNDGSWLRVKEQENGLHGEQGADNQGQSAGGQGDSGGIPRQSDIQGVDIGLRGSADTGNDPRIRSVGNKAMERWVALDDFRTKFGEDPIRIYDSNIVETRNKELFLNQFKKLRAENEKGLRVSSRGMHDPDLKGARYFMTPDGSYTCAVTKKGVLTAVCSTAHKGDYNFTEKGTFKDLLNTAIQNGVRKCDCVGADLVKLYTNPALGFGFKVVGQSKWNPEYWNTKDADGNNETDPKKLFPDENGEPSYYYLARTDENPEIQDVSDWTQEDIEKLQDSFAQKSPVEKASASINPATGKPYQIGETKVRPDGSKWVKTGTFSWAKAGTKDAEEAQKKTDSDGDGKAEKKEVEGQSSKDAEDILSVYGEKGLYQLTKAGMYNLLFTHGVDDPKSMKWAEKVEKVKEIVKELQEGNDTKIKTEGKQEFTEEDYHILHNSDLVGDASSLENTTLHTRNGDVKLKFTEDGGLTDQTYDELMQKVDPIEGGHWGSAETTNATALAVALVNAPDWKPINQMKNGQLAKYDQQLSDGMYAQSLIRGIGLRKFAQEKLKHPDMSRERIPNFYRGMTIDASQYEQLLAGEIDTIELTGCTAITSFEDVADHYASSFWTRSFGAGRRSIKLVIERDDYMDNSIGMFHPNTKGYAHGNRNIAFELLTGSPSFYIKSVQRGGDFDIDKSADAIVRDVSNEAQEKYDLVKDVDGASIYDPNGYWKYDVKDANGNSVLQADQYWRFVRDRSALKAKSLVQDLNRRIADWSKQYYKDHILDFFSKVKNGNVGHANNRKIRMDWNNDVKKAWEESDLYKECEKWRSHNPFIDSINIDRSELPDEAERAKIDSYYNNEDYIKREAKDYLNDPMNDLDLTWRSTAQGQYERWREAQDSKKGTLTMKMFLDKRKPLEKSYKTQVDKTEKEYKDFDDFYKWRNQIIQGLPQARERIASEIKQKYNLTDDEMNSVVGRYDDGQIRGFYAYGVPNRLPEQERQELKDYLRKIDYSEPRLTNYGIDYHRGYGEYFEPADNPYISDELKKSPYFTRNEEYPDSRYKQLANMRQNYENAKRENGIIAKYDIYNTPKSEIQAKYDESGKRHNTATKKLEKYVGNKWMESIGDKYGWNDREKQFLRTVVTDGREWQLPSDESRQDFINFKNEMIDKDKECKKLEKEIEEAGALNGELVQALMIYREYGDKLADMHKSSRPLEVHVVCGRGKKSMTAGADDQLEEDNGSDQ